MEAKGRDLEKRIKEIEKFRDDMQTITGQVFFILREFPQSRENDGMLLCHWLQMFKGIGTYQGLFALARENKFNFESVRRCRQKIQAAGFFLPSDEVILKRRRLQEVWRSVQGRQIS
jgi:hypothetical protein